MIPELLVVEGGRARCHPDEIYPRGYIAPQVQLVHPRPQAAADPIADHRSADPTRDGVRHVHGRAGVTSEVANRERSAPYSPTVAMQRIEGGSASYRPDQADSRARPLRRRAFSTARPARSAIR